MTVFTARHQLIYLMVLSCVSLVYSASQKNKCLHVGSFNVKWFNVGKSADHGIMSILVDVIQRYDVMLMMEIRDDSSQTAMTRLWKMVNVTSPFGLSLSKRLGRHSTSYAEQYGFFYRIGKAYLAGTIQYKDSLGDEFEREPYSVLIKTSPRSSHPGIAFIGVHIQPKVAVAEMGHMVDVTKSILQQWNTNKGVILGDMNADCRYMSRIARTQTPLRTVPGFTWLIPDTADTTVSRNTDCAYDRIIVTDTVAYRSASVFNFEKEYSLTYDEAHAVSDHFPVESRIC
uniref:Deoxyribonuclease n=2 Tax=Arion vulgaris TaxID=1028688 RepID=A0A0B6ZLV9_9EUPU